MSHLDSRGTAARDVEAGLAALPVRRFQGTPGDIERQWYEEVYRPEWAKELMFPVASGWIAGESLLGVLLVMWEHGPDLVGRLTGFSANP